MDDSEDDSPAFSASDATSSPALAVAPTDLEVAVRDFFVEGFPSLQNLARAFALSNPPEELKTPILRIFFRYLNIVDQALAHDMSLEGAHTCACNAVMGDPKVAALVESFMAQGVQGIVVQAVENR